MNEIAIFNNEQFGEIRVVERDGNPWFVAADVCRALELTNSRMATERLYDDEKGVSSIDTPGGIQEMTVVSEPGLYALVLGSRKPEAVAFQRWITHEVIPSIRKHGAYAAPNVLDQIIADPDLGIRLFQQLKEEREKNVALTTANAVQAQQLAEAQPKVCYYDRVLKSKGLVKIGVIASDYGMTAQKLNKVLEGLRVQYKQGGLWLLYEQYRSGGYTQTETYTFVDQKTGESKTNCLMKWTQKGRLFLYDLLKDNGYLPLCEQEAA